MMVRPTAGSRGASVARAIVILLCLPVFEITAAASTLDANDVRARLLPRPRHVDPVNEVYHLTDAARLQIAGTDLERCRQIGERFADLVQEEFGVRVAVDEPTRADTWQLRLWEGGVAPGGVPRSGSTHEESYALEVNGRGAVGSARTAQGLLWSAMTLRQLLLRRDNKVVAVGCRVDDWPRYAWRGFMIDSGRAPNSLAQMKRIVRVCSAFKLNYVVFREGDDELAAVRYRTNRLGRENPFALTMDEIAEFVAYCDRHGVAVVPEIESLGHSTAKGFAYPDLVAGGAEQKYPGIGVHIRKAYLRPDDPRSLELLASIYGEWFPLLRSPYVHLGLDEVRLPVEVQAEHLARLLPLVDRVAAKSDKQLTPMVWADAPPTPEAYRERVVRVLWDYGDGDGVSLENPHLVKQGIKTLTQKGCSERVIMAGGSGSKHTPLSKTDDEAAFNNLAVWARLGDEKPNFVGLLAVQWHGNMLDLWLPDFACAADYAWSPPADIPAFDTQMARVKSALSRLRDVRTPRQEEVDRPAWDGIWLRGDQWESDILGGTVPRTLPARR